MFFGFSTNSQMLAFTPACSDSSTFSRALFCRIKRSLRTEVRSGVATRHRQAYQRYALQRIAKLTPPLMEFPRRRYPDRIDWDLCSRINELFNRERTFYIASNHSPVCTFPPLVHTISSNRFIRLSHQLEH